MTKFTRFSLAIAGLLVVAALVQPVFAACGSFATLTTIPQAGGRSYIWNEDVFTPGYAYPPYVIAYTPPVTLNLMATWWRLGSGDPIGGVGDDIGGFDAVGSGAVYFYGPGSYGSYFGANLFTGWGADPGIDGCIGAANSCTCLLLVDQNGTDMQLALVGGRSDATQSTAFAQPGNDGSGNAAPIILKNVGKPTLTTLRVAGTNVDIQASLAPLQGIYDPTACDCQNGAVVRYYTQKVGRGGAAPSSRDISSGWQATGVSAGLGATSSAITVNCAGDDDVFVAAEIEFTTVAPGAAGFTTLGKVTSNSTRVECGPNVVDQPVQIERPRQNRPLAPRGKGRR